MWLLGEGNKSIENPEGKRATLATLLPVGAIENSD